MLQQECLKIMKTSALFLGNSTYERINYYLLFIKLGYIELEIKFPLKNISNAAFIVVWQREKSEDLSFSPLQTPGILPPHLPWLHFAFQSLLPEKYKQKSLPQ